MKKDPASFRPRAMILLSAAIIAVAFLTVAFFLRNQPVAIVPVKPKVPELMQIEKVVPLSDGTRYPQRPVWSPNGNMIAFAMSNSDGIEVMNSDGTERRVLTADPNSGYKFAWSPDSTEIAYRYNDVVNSIYKIKKVNVADEKIEVLHEQDQELHPPEWVWSEKGKRVTFVSVPGNQQFSTVWQKCEGVLPAGKMNTDKILYSDEGNVWIMNEDGREKKQLSFETGFDPVWSPDRTRIVYSQMDTLILIDPDGQNRLVLGYGNHPSWSPDGKKLVYQVTQDHTHAPGDSRQHGEDTTVHVHNDKTHDQMAESDLYVINADGTRKTRLTNTPDKMEVDPGWSPDGQKIVYRLENTGEIQVAELKR